LKIIYLNKQFLAATEANINIADRGFLLGDGLFETLSADQGKIAFFKEHYERLKNSAAYLKIPFNYSESDLLKICGSLLEKNNLSNTAVLRITLTRGLSERGIDSPMHGQSTLLITAAAYSPPTKSITACITDIIRNEHSVISKLKTLNYLENILARQTAKERGFDEGIMLNTQHHITETSVANLFFKIGDTLVTPPLSSGVLPGIIRQQVLNACKQQNIPCLEQTLTLDDIQKASHAFQTNSLIGLQVITKISLSENKIISLEEALPIPDS
jgi:branched-chain amino acid aminotransferase